MYDDEDERKKESLKKRDTVLGRGRRRECEGERFKAVQIATGGAESCAIVNDGERSTFLISSFSLFR